MLDARLFALIEACQGAIAFGVIKMLQSKAGTTFVKAWTQEHKKLFGLTMINVICLAILDFANGVH